MFLLLSKALTVILRLISSPPQTILAAQKGSHVVVSDLKSFARLTETDSQEVPAT